MKTLIAMVLAALGLASTSAFAAAGWEDDFDKAAEQAKKEGKYMIVDFSGSDWCGWCIKLDKEVFSQKEFKKFAKDNLITVMLDFPRNKPQSKKLKERNEELMTKHGVRGFPTVLVMSPDGEVIGRTGYKAGGPEEYVKHVQEFIDAHKAKKS